MQLRKFTQEESLKRYFNVDLLPLALTTDEEKAALEEEESNNKKLDFVSVETPNKQSSLEIKWVNKHTKSVVVCHLLFSLLYNCLYEKIDISGKFKS